MGVLGKLVKQGRHFQQLIEADSLALQSDVVKSFDKDGDVHFGLICGPDSDGKNMHAKQETWAPFLVGANPVKKGMTTHSCVLSWQILRKDRAWSSKGRT